MISKNRPVPSLSGTYPGYRPLCWHNGALYVSKGYTLFKLEGKSLLDERGDSFQPIGSFKPEWFRRLATHHRLSQRLLRTGFHSLAFLPDGKIIAILAKFIAVLLPGKNEFEVTWAVQRGTRPMGIAVTPEGWLFWGEYFSNPQREEVHVYGSFDGGISWKVVYTFPAKTIRHIHNILYDPYEDILWTLTGDENELNESKIIKSDKDWKNIEVFEEGSQQYRAVSMVFQRDDVYFATDTPYEPNHIYRIDRSTMKVSSVAEISGPCMWTSIAGGLKLFATAAEPGPCYHPAACIWGLDGGGNASKLVEHSKDGWHPRYFQFGNMVLPRGKTDLPIIAAMPVATKKTDHRLFLWNFKQPSYAHNTLSY